MLIENLLLRSVGLSLGILFLGITFKQKFSSSINSILWYTFSIALIIVAIYPGIFDWFVITDIVVRALDFLIIFSILGLYLLVFKLYQQNEENNRVITNLVREVALKFKEKK